MKRSKFRYTDRSKEQASRQVDSDGSGSVISLQSSSSSDGKYPGNHHSARTGRPVIQTESVEEIGAQKREGNGFKDDSTMNHQKLEKLQKKLQGQPNENTLDEIIHTIKNQNGIKDSSVAEMLMPLGNDCVDGVTTYPSLPLDAGSLGWNSTSPLQMR